MRCLIATLLVAWPFTESGLIGAQQPAVPVALDTVRFAPSLAVDLAAATCLSPGLCYRDLAPGSGPAVLRGSEVTVRFEGRLADGALVTPAAQAAEPFTFRLGRELVVAGWEHGLAGMRVGGRRQLVMTPAYAYGARRVAEVPEHSVLVFDVQLLGVR